MADRDAVERQVRALGLEQAFAADGTAAEGEQLGFLDARQLRDVDVLIVAHAAPSIADVVAVPSDSVSCRDRSAASRAAWAWRSRRSASRRSWSRRARPSRIRCSR